MDAKYADLAIVTSHRGATSARTTTTTRAPRRHQPLASVAANKPAVAKATSRLARGGGRTVKPITFNACL